MGSSRPPLPKLLDALAPVVRPAMLEHFTPDCCIATSRVLRHAFHFFGYDAEAVPVTTYIFNAQMAALLRQGVEIPSDAAQRENLLNATGAWSVGITAQSADVGAPVIGGRFGGHLVLRVMNTLVDASLQQAERPERGIVLPPLLSCAMDGSDFFLKRVRGQRRCGVTVNDCEIIYRRTTDYSFKNAPDWVRTGSPYTDALRRIVGATERQLKGERSDA